MGAALATHGKGITLFKRVSPKKNPHSPRQRDAGRIINNIYIIHYLYRKIKWRRGFRENSKKKFTNRGGEKGRIGKKTGERDLTRGR